MTIREQTEHFEDIILAPHATHAKNSKGRLAPISKCDMRTDFQRDRDRILHSKAFRRLKHKTQVFISPEGDHYRTRLTHTLEVSQIARTIARSLRLNEDLTEAIAMGHDLGHTPFGHSGESALNTLSPTGFRHNEQSVRVVDVIEKLNLTYEVRDGILRHTGSSPAATPEGNIIRLADRIAYINHDIDDSIRAGVLSADDLPKDAIAVLGKTHGERIETMIKNVIDSSEGADIKMSGDVFAAMNALREFMFANVYIGSDAKIEEKKVFGVMEGLYKYYMQNLSALPDITEPNDPSRSVIDYISGMSDRYAIYIFKQLYIPRSWEQK